MNCVIRARDEKLIDDYFINFFGEALIHRCRNRHANHALKEQVYDRFLTIDSDISFTWDDFKRIALSTEDFIGGSYPLKCFPPVVNFNPLPGKGQELLRTDRGYDFEAFEEYKKVYADELGLAEVRHLPTGFMCVSMRVFGELSKTVGVYHSFAQDAGKMEGFFDFYPSAVHKGEFESEDWSFCRMAREAGFKIMFDTNVVTKHVGSHVYEMGQVFGTIDTKVKSSNN